MLFHEIYGYYYQTVAAILDLAVNGELNDRRLAGIVSEKAFGESALVIPQSLKDGTWPLLDEDGTTVLHHSPKMPLTTLEKRWLKTLLADPRIALFDPSPEGLEDVTPLYRQEDIVYFDRYGDGDPFTDPGYIDHFRTIMKAIREQRHLMVHFDGHRKDGHQWECAPFRMEYSSKDDKFRFFANGAKEALVVNVGRVTSCELLEKGKPEEFIPKRPRIKKVVLELTDERKALERCLLHFSHLEKETERLDDDHYRITLRYDRGDETEMVIRILSFGPMVKVVSPPRMVDQIKKRIDKQKKMRMLTAK